MARKAKKAGIVTEDVTIYAYQIEQEYGCLVRLQLAPLGAGTWAGPTTIYATATKERILPIHGSWEKWHVQVEQVYPSSRYVSLEGAMFAALVKLDAACSGGQWRQTSLADYMPLPGDGWPKQNK